MLTYFLCYCLLLFYVRTSADTCFYSDTNFHYLFSCCFIFSLSGLDDGESWKKADMFDDFVSHVEGRMVNVSLLLFMLSYSQLLFKYIYRYPPPYFLSFITLYS